MALAYHERLTDEERKCLELVTRRQKDADKAHHDQFRRKGERLLRRYHNYVEMRDYHAKLDRPDRDAFVRDQANEYGLRLTIPYAFATVETILPRMLSNRPRMLILPRARASEENVEPVRHMIDSQQERISYELVLQDIGKDGLNLGLGVQKTLWRKKKRMLKMLAQGAHHPLIVKEVERTDFDGPVCERVDPFDWFWDPMASDLSMPGLASAEWAIHRTWRSTRYVLDRMAEGVWKELSAEEVESMGPATKYDEVMRERMKAQGYEDYEPSKDGVHEVWEYHEVPCREYPDGRVIVVLDGCWVAAKMHNPYWHGELPFQVYRPTKIPGSMVGKGEIEPIEELCDEMDMLRTDRRDNARLKLNAPIFYDEGAINVADIKWGAGWGNPMSGPPRDSIWIPPIGDIPNSGYQEEVNLARDIERTTGISETVSGTDNVQQTATGAQLVQAAANVRIQSKTRRLEAETIKPAAQQWVALNQQMILTAVEVRVPVAPTQEDPDRRWGWWQIGPGQLAGEFEVECEGGATAPENIPQRRADAQGKMALLSIPGIDARAMVVSILRDMGFTQPEALMQADERVPSQTLQYLVEAAGVPPEVIEEALTVGRELEEQQRMGGGQQPQQGAEGPPAVAAAA